MGNPYLIPVDIEDLSIEKNAIPLGDLYNDLTENKTARVTFFIDACFSGAVPIMSEDDARAWGGRPANKTPIKGNSIIFAATSPKETAKPFKKQKHGAFTYCLLRALQDTKGNITYEELGKQLKKDVKELVKKQNPTATPSPDIKNNEWKNWKINE